MPDAEKYLIHDHVPIFMAAAHRFQVWILLRGQNVASRDYFGKRGYIPKRLDCKAKTAHKSDPQGKYKLAGLVASPTIHPEAFNKDVQKDWENFLPHLYIPREGENRTYLPAGILYSIEMDPEHEHYGCVYFTSYGLASKKMFIYGDYDLYGLVSAKNPTDHRFVEEYLFGEGQDGVKHFRSPELRDVQQYLNSRIGVPMIQHGAQESYSAHTDENILIFGPNGELIERIGKAEIETWYETQFQGRRTHPAGAPAKPASGLWKKT